MKWKSALLNSSAVTIVLLFSIINGLLCSSADNPDCKETLKELRQMIDTTVLDYGDYEVMLPPYTYCPGDFIRYIFATPEANTVGTNELDNAITMLKFKTDEELDQSVVKKDFMEMVTGPFEFRFLPVWSDKEIAYSQSRGFLIVNIPDKNVEIHTVLAGLSGRVENIHVFNGGDRTFVLEINTHAAGLGNYEKLLKVIRFENDTFTVIAERPAGVKTSSYTEPWFVYQKKIFVYNDSTTKLDVFDEQFKPENHALAQVFNKNRNSFRRLQDIRVHPFLPFALVIEMGKEPDVSKFDSLPPEARIAALTPLYNEISRTTLYLFRWTHQDEKQRFVPLLSVAGSIWNTYNPKNNYSDFEFSPDGKWCVFRDYTGNAKNPVFVAVPINDKNPLYLGKPIKLGNALREDAIGPTGTAWTTNPTAFIMCDGLILYRWNLDKYKSLQKVKASPSTPDPFIKNKE